MTRHAVTGVRVSAGLGLLAVLAGGCADQVAAPANGAPNVQATSAVYAPRPLPTRFAYVLADQPYATLPYVPDPRYSYNGMNGTLKVTRVTIGTYDVMLGGMAKGADPNKKETILVSPYGSSGSKAACSVGWWADSGPDLQVRVYCANPTTGAAQSHGFTLLMVGAGSLAGEYAFAQVFRPLDQPSYHPAAMWSYNTSGNPMTVSDATIPNWFLGDTLDLGIPYDSLLVEWRFVSDYGLAGWTHCALESADPLVGVGCGKHGQYTILQLKQGRAASRFGAAWVSCYEKFLQCEANSPAIAIHLAGVGMFQVMFPNLATPQGHSETVILTTWNALSGGVWPCRILYWQNYGSNLGVTAECTPAYFPPYFEVQLLVIE